MDTEFTLPCGVKLMNRICKAAMTERLSSNNYLPNKAHYALYKQWAEGGSGLLLTGNIMVDKNFLESAGNIALEDDLYFKNHREEITTAIKDWISVSTSRGAHFWPQIGHPGRQANKITSSPCVSASDVQLHFLGLHTKPRPLLISEIDDLVEKFTFVAQLFQSCGASGCQVHAAHGYLVSQFLSPLTNKRTDEYGGSIENRSRLLIRIVRSIRQKCGPGFAISVKLNSSDFQKGGFDVSCK
jgi:2,4-dienoyl-CoA reductase-like NADH-dependent reductase (Old Yellow Enzyme family)